MNVPSLFFGFIPGDDTPSTTMAGQKNSARDGSDPVDANSLWGPAALDAKREESRRHQARFATERRKWIEANPYYYESIKRLLRFIIEPDCAVLDVRCQTGHLLDAVRPSRGVGVEISEEMTTVARALHPDHEYLTAFPEELELDEKFDYILWENVTDAADVVPALKRLRHCSDNHTRLIVYTYNHLWEPIVTLAERLRIKMPMPEQSWLSEFDLQHMLTLGGFEWMTTYRVMLLPKYIPLISPFINRGIGRLPLLNRLGLTTVMVARPIPHPVEMNEVTISVVIPCKNERGNVEPAVKRIPAMGNHTEIIFCDDKSTDGTADEVRSMQQAHPDMDIRLVAGPGVCKSKNVWTGFDAAKGDILMILDADLTVMPEELPQFVEALIQGHGEFINGSRLVYPMQRMAMKFTNMLGNKAFGALFSYLLDQRIKDTLCGTKVLWRRDWLRIKPMNETWGPVDRWGDYELLFGASKLHLRIIDLPVHYQERLYGTTKMVRVLENGLNMLRMCVAALRKLKLGY